jgi:hypothetical protein
MPVISSHFMKMAHTPTRASHEPRTGRPAGDRQGREGSKTVTPTYLECPKVIWACCTRGFQLGGLGHPNLDS